MAPGSRLSKAPTQSVGGEATGRPTSSRSLSVSEPSANTHAPQDKSQAMVEEEPTTPAFQTRVSTTTRLLRSNGLFNEANEGTSIMNTNNEASDVPGQFDEQIPLPDEGRPKRVRDPTWGRGLNKLTKAMGSKMRLNFVDGKKRPEHPVQAAKLASESGIVVRDHMPIYTHWKEYKNQTDKDLLKDHLGYLAIRFNMDVSNNTTKKVCSGLLRDGVLQERYRLKRKYFDGVPEHEVLSKKPPKLSEEEWTSLVRKWSDPNHKRWCEKNKQNRGNVKFHQATGSQSYVAKRYCLKEQSNREEPDPIDLFKASHFSKTKGYSDAVQEAIDAMETAMVQSAAEDDDPKPIDEIVGEVLSEYSRTNKFLQNMGIRSTVSQESSANSSSARIRELEYTLQMRSSQIENAHKSEEELRATISSQQEEMMALKKQIDEANEANKRQEEHMAILKQKQETTDSLLLRLLSQTPLGGLGSGSPSS